MEKKVTPLSKKNEILDAYHELLDKLQQSKEENPKTIQESRVKEETVKAAIAMTDEKIIGQISSLKLSLNITLDKIEDDLSKEYQQLKKLREAIAIEEQRLKDFYQINAAADTLAALLSAQKDKKAQFETDMTGRLKDLEKEIQVKEEKQKELEDIAKKQRIREEEEYQYNLQLARKKEKDQYEQKKMQLERDLTEKKEAFENEIRSREQSIALAEKELSELRTNSEKFPSELEKAVLAAVKESTVKLSKEYEVDKQILAKDHESELKLRNHQVESLNARIKDLEQQLKQALLKAETAENNTKEITLKAIQTSGQIKIIEKETKQ
jgi:hypothetical protein